ncbi:MAG: TIGR00269 family protein [Candidatus Bathyarchaeota archaeon]|nr:TIGR00269 family protein [Candidatus Bathyarchaeota archaeon]
MKLHCDLCGNKNIFYNRTYEGVKFCKKCFKKNIEEKVRRNISKHSMLSHDDRVAVGVSGGKDSLTLLSILHKLSKKHPRSELIAVTIDEGIRNYREEAIKLAEEFCKKLELEQFVFSFKELFGKTLDELVLEKKDELSECSYCGILRRRALDEAGKRVKANKIATAHNLDDEIQTFLLNVFHGGIERIARLNVQIPNGQNAFIRKIKPFSEVYEKEVALYAYVSEFKFQTIPCPYAANCLRNDIRSMLNQLEEKHPGAKYSCYRSKERLTDVLKKHSRNLEIKNCRICKSPSSSDICEVCKTLCRVSI